MFGQDRNQLRKIYCEAWQKHQQNHPLEPLEAQIVAVVGQHPEYHSLLEKMDPALQREYLPESGETNPFLHMGMHIAIQEQLNTDRPSGISALYQQLLPIFADPHSLEHRIMDCLGEMIWQAQKDGTMPDEQRYLACIRSISKKRK